MSQSNVITFPKAQRPAAIAPPPFGARQPAATSNQAHSLVVPFPANARSSVDIAPLNPGALGDALADRRFVMHYQPQYELSNECTTAAEALIRLIDINGELIYPDRFIEQAEQSGLIVLMGRLVIAQVCADLAALRASGVMLSRIAINVSAHQLNIDHTLADFIDATLGEYSLNYHDLEFELIERQALTADSGGMSTLRELVDRGSRIVIDDFGTGFSSVAYLTELPVSGFKLDRSLIAQLGDDKSDLVTKSLLAMANHLDLHVVAEGIETTAQQDILLAAGCPHGQGFGYARPMSMTALEVFLRKHPCLRLISETDLQD